MRSGMKKGSQSAWGPTLHTLLVLSVPTIIEQIMSTLLQYVDTSMVGQLGEKATAAVSITTNITWLVNSVPGAIGTAVLILISRALGAGDREEIRRLSQQALFLAVICGLTLGLVSIALSPFIPRWMGAEQEIWQEASRYFTIISIPLIFRSVSNIMAAALRAVQDTRTPMRIGLAANGLNIVLNYFLIYPAGLGVSGAAIASAVSYTVSGLCMLAACRRSPFLSWKIREFKVHMPLLRKCAAVGMPVLGTSAVSCMGYVVFAGLVSGMGTTVFAAHSIAVTAETIFYVPGYGLRTAASTLVGSAYGERDSEKMSRISWVSVLVTVCMMCISGLILYVGSVPLMRLFTPSIPVVDLGAEMLRLVALSEPFFGLMVVLEGIFYGMGRTRYPFLVETIGMWGIRIFLTFLCVNVWGLGLRAVWYCMIADNVGKALMLAIPFLRQYLHFPEKK